jgi:flagellar biosynthesis/type III secretory pathway M-ring protein FliF/YscJ
MTASMFSWWGLVISVIVLVVILAIVFFVVRGIVRFFLRRMPERPGPPPSSAE